LAVLFLYNIVGLCDLVCIIIYAQPEKKLKCVHITAKIKTE